MNEAQNFIGGQSNLKMKSCFISLLSICFIFMAAHITDAHVTVHPSQSNTNAYEEYTIRVPVEKDSNTTEITLQVPKKVKLVSVLPINNWDYTLNKNKDDDITSVVWKANNSGIGPNEFIAFSFIAANPGKPGKVSWKALQKYADGSLVEWVGPSNAEEPASVTNIIDSDKAAADGDHDNAEEKTVGNNDTLQQTAGTSSTNWLPTILASVAILLSLISLFRKKSS